MILFPTFCREDKPAPDVPTQVIYNDSLGNPLESEFNAVAIVAVISAIDNNAEMIDLGLSQQTNNSDCGPLTVDNLIKLSTQQTQGLSKQELSALLFQPLEGSTSRLRQQQRALLSSLTEAEILALCNQNKSKKDVLPILQPQPYQDLTLITALWKFLPDQRFVNECIRRFSMIEISLKSKKQPLQSRANEFISSILTCYIGLYKKQDDKSSVDTIKILEKQLAIITSQQPFEFVDGTIKWLMMDVFVRQIIDANPIYKKQLEEQYDDRMVNTLLLEIRGSVVLIQQQEKFQTSVSPCAYPWIKDVLNFMKSTSNGHEKLKDYYIEYAGLVFIEDMLKETKDLNTIFVTILSNYHTWLNDAFVNYKDYVCLVFKLLMRIMDLLEMQKTLFYLACSNQIESLQSNVSRWFLIPMDFLIDLKYFELLYFLKKELAKASEQNENATTQKKINPSASQRFFQAAPAAVQQKTDDSIITQLTELHIR